jgi:two-component system, chemotaxis family, protein-glutamate methylesterase/glutaminase
MAARDIIVIGASAGGLQALTELSTSFPKDLSAAVFVVIHTSPNNSGVLPAILERSGPLTASFAVDDEEFRLGHIYVAPPDHHLLVKPGRVRVPRGPEENGFRPAVDPLFRTAARAYDSRVIGIILSGVMDDGTHGLSLIKEAGGIAIVQNPEEALISGMPLSAIQSVEVDYIMSVTEMGPLISRLVQEEIAQVAAATREWEWEPDVAEMETDMLQKGHPGPPSPLTCPACGGALWEMPDGEPLRFRCHVGHGYTAETLAAGQSNEIDGALWAALRALEEKAALRRRVASRANIRNMTALAETYETQAHDAEQRAAVIRGVLIDDSLSEEPETIKPAARQAKSRSSGPRSLAGRRKVTRSN